MGKCVSKTDSRSKYRVSKGGGPSEPPEQTIPIDLSKSPEFALYVQREKDRQNAMSLNEKRMVYRCRMEDVISMDKMAPWGLTGATTPCTKDTDDENDVDYTYPVDEDLNNKVSVVKANIALLEVDAVVGIINTNVGSASGVTDDLNKGAGRGLRDECLLYNHCDDGQVVMTSGYFLPARHVLLTVPPFELKGDALLASCYRECLKLVKDNKLKSVAFPCISSGRIGLPLDFTSDVALQTVRGWMLQNRDYLQEMDRIVFCVHKDKALEVYKHMLRVYFPLTRKPIVTGPEVTSVSVYVSTSDNATSSGVETGESDSPSTSEGGGTPSISQRGSAIEAQPPAGTPAEETAQEASATDCKESDGGTVEQKDADCKGSDGQKDQQNGTDCKESDRQKDQPTNTKGSEQKESEEAEPGTKQGEGQDEKQAAKISSGTEAEGTVAQTPSEGQASGSAVTPTDN